jgi:hypothetical protein
MGMHPYSRTSLTRQQAGELLEALDEAESVAAHCAACIRDLAAPDRIRVLAAPDRIRVSTAGGDIFVRPLALRELAIEAALEIVAKLADAGYVVPGAKP